MLNNFFGPSLARLRYLFGIIIRGALLLQDLPANVGEHRGEILFDELLEGPVALFSFKRELNSRGIREDGTHVLEVFFRELLNL